MDFMAALAESLTPDECTRLGLLPRQDAGLAKLVERGVLMNSLVESVSSPHVESDASDAGIEIGVDVADGSFVPAASYGGKVYYWTGDGFSPDRGDGLSFDTEGEADGALSDVEEYVNAGLSDASEGETDFASILEAKKSANRAHRDGVVQSAAMPAIDPDKYPPIKGMEGPFRFRKSGILYYDPKEGKYYDRGKDVYLDADERVESLQEGRGNPWHNHTTGEFTTKNNANRVGKGSFSLKSDPRSKKKVKGSGKAGPKMVKTPQICGRPARSKGLNVRCWTGTPYPDGFGRTPKELTAKGMKTKNIGAGRGWRKGQTDRAVGRKMRGEWVDVDVKDVLFEIDLVESDRPSWSLVVADKAAVVQQDGDNFVWEAYWTSGESRESIASGSEETVEDAWSAAAVGMGLEFHEKDLRGSKSMTFIGSRGDFDSLQAEFDGEATFKVSGGSMVVKADADTLRRIKRYAENNLGLEIRESEREKRPKSASDCAPCWRKSSTSAIDRLRSLGV
jgi:hypothetical protein